MRVIFKNIKRDFSEEQITVIKEFTKILQLNFPLKKDVDISFDLVRRPDMTTGVRLDKHHIHVLTRERLLIDILRTLSHEWVHEFQHQIMGVKDTEKITNIGGPEENMAAMVAAIILKKFQNDFPKFRKILYHENHF